MTNATTRSRPAAPRRARTAVLSLLVAALAACGDDPSGPGDGAGSTRFSFRGTGPVGTVEGIYDAEGAPSFPVPPVTQTYALGQRISGEHTLRIVSNVAYSAQQTADFAWVTIPRLTVGSVQIDGICPGESCASVKVALQVSTAGTFDQAKYSCDLYDGVIRINSISEGRATGTFSGTGRCLGEPGTEDLDSFAVTGGTFDVRVIEVPS